MTGDTPAQLALMLEPKCSAELSSCTQLRYAMRCLT